MNDTPSKSLKTEVGGLDLNLDYLSSIGNITGIALFWLFCIGFRKIYYQHDEL